MTEASLQDTLLEISEVLEKVDNSAKNLAESHQLSRRWQATVIGLFIVGVLQLGSSGVVVALAVVNHSLGQRTSQTLNLVKSCTDPAGKCARRGLQQQAKAVASLTLSQLEASWCSTAHPTSFRAAQRCLIRLSKETVT